MTITAISLETVSILKTKMKHLRLLSLVRKSAFQNIFSEPVEGHATVMTGLDTGKSTLCEQNTSLTCSYTGFAKQSMGRNSTKYLTGLLSMPTIVTLSLRTAVTGAVFVTPHY